MRYTKLAKDIIKYALIINVLYIILMTLLSFFGVIDVIVKTNPETLSINIKFYSDLIVNGLFRIALIYSVFLYLKPWMRRYEATIGEYDEVDSIIEIDINKHG